MPFDGSGGTSQPTSSMYPAVSSTLIESAKFNISVADIYTMLASCIVKDGQTTTTARVPFAAGISTDTVSEKTVGTGVTLDSVLLKDGRIDTTQGADIASASTTNLETATGNVVDITGTTGITAITLSQGHWRLARFTGALTLTNGASLILPNATDYTTAAGDYILFVGYASSVVRAYILPTSGPIPFVDSQPVIVGSSDKTKKVRFEVDGLTTATTRVLTVPDADITLANWSTGDVKLTLKTTADSGWVLMDDKTIGDASSSATGRANADTAALFTLLWTNTADADCAVSTGRGATAAADFAAHKTIALPKTLGRALAVYGAGSGLTSRALAHVVGEETHVLTTTEMPSHTHNVNYQSLLNGGGTGGDVKGTGSTVATTSAGSDGAHNNMQPSVFLNVMVKL